MLVQLPSAWQLCVPTEHSSISKMVDRAQKSNLKLISANVNGLYQETISLLLVPKSEIKSRLNNYDPPADCSHE